MEVFVEGDLRSDKRLNPNKKLHREKFAEKCEKMLDNTNVEN